MIVLNFIYILLVKKVLYFYHPFFHLRKIVFQLQKYVKQKQNFECCHRYFIIQKKISIRTFRIPFQALYDIVQIFKLYPGKKQIFLKKYNLKNQMN